MKTAPSILAARDALEALTPLDADCGALCGARCCQSGDNGEGMLLFPGEECLYKDARWARVVKSSARGAKMLTCDGTCPRAERPLACMVFPLTPYIKDGRLRVRMDPRARPMCPLYDSGIDGLAPRFVSAVREAMRLVWDNHSDFIELWSDQIDEFMRLRKAMRRPADD